jgi:hypothetical protein
MSCGTIWVLAASNCGEPGSISGADCPLVAVWADASRWTPSTTSPSVTEPPSNVTTFFAPESTSEDGDAGAQPARRDNARTTKLQTKATLAEEKLLKKKILTCLVTTDPKRPARL